MTRLHYWCVAILILFLATHQHQLKQKANDLIFATTVASITSSVLPDRKEATSKDPLLVPDRGAITEERAIILSVLFCISLCVVVFFLVHRERKIKGKKDFQIPLIAISIMLSLIHI